MTARQATTGLRGGFTTFKSIRPTGPGRFVAVTPLLEPGYYGIRLQIQSSMGYSEPSMAVEVEIEPRVCLDAWRCSLSEFLHLDLYHSHLREAFGTSTGVDCEMQGWLHARLQTGMLRFAHHFLQPCCLPSCS